MKAIAAVLLLTAATVWGQTTSTGLTAEALLAKLDRNETSVSAHVVGTLTVEDRFGSKVAGFESWTKGADQSLIVFTSGEEKGQKILRLKDTLYVAYPDADKPIKIQGAALKDSVAGSDLSYEDMAGDTSLISRYTPALSGEETLNGELCAVLTLTARKAGIAYPIVKTWVSLKDFTARKTERYSQNKRLLKTEEVLATTVSGGRTVTTQAVITDAIKVKSKTRFDLTKVEIDVPVTAKFSLEELTF